MKENYLLLLCLMFNIFSFAQKENESSVIKYSVLDSQITIKKGLSLQLEKAFTAKSMKAGNLVLKSMSKTDVNSINKWLMLKKKQSIYKVDLSAFITKYIGETEKNLDKIFNKAETNNWILLFDEADALFGKRTAVKDTHDKYANQEIAYFIAKMKKHPELVIIHCKQKDCSNLFSSKGLNIITATN